MAAHDRYIADVILTPISADDGDCLVVLISPPDALLRGRWHWVDHKDMREPYWQYRPPFEPVYAECAQLRRNDLHFPFAHPDAELIPVDVLLLELPQFGVAPSGGPDAFLTLRSLIGGLLSPTWDPNSSECRISCRAAGL